MVGRHVTAPTVEAVAARRGRPVLLVEDGTFGGIQRAVDYLATELEVTPDAPGTERLALRGRGSLAASLGVFVTALGRLAWGVLRGRYRLLHVNMTQRGSTLRAFFVVLIGWAGRTPVILHLHSSQYRDFLGSLPAPALALVRWMFHRADRVVVLGDTWAEYVRDTLRLEDTRVMVMRNAVPGPAVVPTRDSEGPVRVLFLGQLGQRKGAGDLIDALAAPDVSALPWQATMAGDGDIEIYRRHAAERGLANRIHFTGWVDQPEVRRHLAEADVMVLPSYAEGLPLSVLEGLANALAVIATPVGAIGEVIEDGVGGLLVPPGDVPALAQALERVIRDEGLRARLATNGRARWEREHAVPVYARRMAALYDEIAPLS